MKIDRRITNGLAWAGVILVVGVPAADLLSAQFSGDARPAQVAVISPVAPVPAPLSQRPEAPIAKPAPAVAVVAPAKPVAPAVAKPAAPAQQAASVVDNFLQDGKALPSYITGGGTVAAPAQVAAAPAQVAVAKPARTPIVTTPAAAPDVDPVQVASIPPQKIAPTPMPLAMRPTPIEVPMAVAAPGDIIIPPGLTPPPLATVTAADLDDWETGPLAEFLARKQGQGSSARVTRDYDANGFFLDQGPEPMRGDRVIGWEEQGFSFFAD